MKRPAIHASAQDRAFDLVNYIILATLLLIVAYPLYFVVIASLSDPYKVSLGKVLLFVDGLTLNSYRMVLEYQNIWIGFRNTTLYTLFGTALNLILTLSAGYGLSYRNLPGRRALMGVFTFTMFFSGGMIPTYLLVNWMGLVNKPAVMVILGAVSVWNMIIARTFFESNIPVELREAAFMDGCSDFRFYLRIALPLSTAVIAVLTIYYAVGHWNEYMKSIIYLRNRNAQTLQAFLRELLITDKFDAEAGFQLDTDDAVNRTMTILSLKYSAIIVSCVPMIILYPFAQKYFMKGVMVGAVKG